MIILPQIKIEENDFCEKFAEKINQNIKKS
jgi:hypothetical protein